MSLPHALLTSLLERTSSGLELARRFDRSIGYFWHATHQQIYRELARMEQAGWVAVEPAEPGAKGGKKIYRVLEAGRDELRRWSAEPSHPCDIREDLLVKLRAEAVVGPLGLEGELKRRLALHRQKLAAYRAIEQHDFAARSLSVAAELQYLGLKGGIEMEECWVRWTLDALATLRRIGHAEGIK